MSILHRVGTTTRINSPALVAVLMTIPDTRRPAFIARLARRVRAIGGTI